MLITSLNKHPYGDDNLLDRHYILKCLNALKKDSKTPGHALQRRRLDSYTYSSLRLLPRLVLDGLWNAKYTFKDRGPSKRAKAPSRKA